MVVRMRCSQGGDDSVVTDGDVSCRGGGYSIGGDGGVQLVATRTAVVMMPPLRCPIHYGQKTQATS